MDNTSRVDIEMMSTEMIDAALNDRERFLLYEEDSVRKVLRFNLEKKYSQKAFLIKPLLNNSQVIATNAEIENHVINRRAPGLGISVRSNNGFTVFEAKSLADLFTCFVLPDEAM